MADVPYLAKIPAGLTVYNAPDGIEWGETAGGLVTIGSLWLGHSRVDDPRWTNGKKYWIKGTFPEYVPPEEPQEPPNADELVFPIGQLQLRDIESGDVYQNAEDVRFVRATG